MMKIQGKYNSAEIFTDTIDNEALRQVYRMLGNPGFANSRIAIMPDVHVGKGAVVGFTMKADRYIIPSVIGVDIGCGIDAYKIGSTDIDMESFDCFVRQHIPGGKQVHSAFVKEYVTPSLTQLVEKVAHQDYERIMASIGTLGGGNHFLELDKDGEDNIWLVIHSGSRNLGLKVCHYHQKKAKSFIKNEFKGAGAYHGMEYMTLDEGGEAYLQDMKIAQDYAAMNRTVMGRIVVEKYFKKRLSDCESVSSIHNYFNFEDQIIRKGAIAAPAGKKVIIPLNMKEGSVIATGKGNSDWNNSAPHGAGRLLSRSEAKERVTLKEFEESMKGIYSSSVNRSTIDESPQVYKSSDEIIGSIKDTVEINDVMRPVYNFKPGNV